MKKLFLTLIVFVTAAMALSAGKAGGTGLPVVFIPGTAGSNLVKSVALAGPIKSIDVNIWLSMNTLKTGTISRALDTDLKPAGIVERLSIPVSSSLETILNKLGMNVHGSIDSDVYGEFLQWGNITWPGNFYTAPYDWRDGPTDSVLKSIDGVVNKAMADHHTNQVILLAHSLGGITARAYIESYGKGKVKALVAMATPWLGSPRTAQALVWGYNFGVEKVITSKANMLVSFGGARPVQVNYPIRLTLLDMKTCQHIAQNILCTYEQLPVDDFNNLLQKATNGQSQSCLLGLNGPQANAYLAKAGPARFQQALDMKKRVLDGDDHGVNNYLLAGLCDSSAGPGDYTDMVMALPTHSIKPLDTKSQATITAESALINQASNLASSLGFSIARDPYVAVAGGTDWGDGTSPLLSATAGNFLKRGMPNPDASSAAHFLGKRTQVQVFDLESGIDHGNIVDDNNFKTSMRTIYEMECGVKLTTPFPKRVHELEVIVHTKKNNSAFDDYGTFNAVTASFGPQDPRAANLIDLNLNSIGGVLSNGASKSVSTSEPTNALAKRQLWDIDLHGLFLKIVKQSNTDDWVFDSVQVKVNGAVVFQGNQTVVLDKHHSGIGIRLP